MNITVKRCGLCQHDHFEPIETFQSQPVSSALYEAPVTQNPLSFDLSLVRCKRCQLIQLVDYPTSSALKLQYDWMTYNEPERHLDDLVSQLTERFKLNNNSKLLGVSYKDATTLTRFENNIHASASTIDYADHTLATDYYGMETIQAVLADNQFMQDKAKQIGRYDIILARHILEHATDMLSVINNLRRLLKEDGHIIFEVPEASKIFQQQNYPFIWEDHISYLFIEDIRAISEYANMSLDFISVYEYAYENSLIFSFSSGVDDEHTLDQPASKKEDLLASFKTALPNKIQYWQDTLSLYKRKGYRICLFGAGHLSVKFINYYQLADYLDLIVDDNPHKTGMYLPADVAKIMPSSSIDCESQPVLCLSTLSPEAETKVIENKHRFFCHPNVTVLQAFSS
jgi:SAM-dependent methyltransferase